MKRSSLRLSALALAAAVLLPITGCGVQTPIVGFTDDGQYLPRDVGEGLVVSPNPLIPDVPMPVGFKAVGEGQSYWRYQGRTREVHHVYQGHAKPGDVTEFYQLNLPANNWALVDIESVGDATVMNYNKGPEALRISTQQGWGIATVTIEIQER